MANGIAALTEKEKQTLRLLVSGYDAKSMARHLGLSIHTVNERLRDARRKMETSSSREAARLLRDCEEQTPQLLGDDRFGDAENRPDGAACADQAEAAGRSRQRALLIGGTVMSFTLALLAFAAFDGNTGQSRINADPAAAAAEIDVARSARTWLAMLDAQDWRGSWNAAGKGIRKSNSFATWARTAQSAHGSFGPARSRELVSVDPVPAPTGGYWLVKFKVSYANKPQDTETLTLAREGGVWRVVGLTVD